MCATVLKSIAVVCQSWKDDSPGFADACSSAFLFLYRLNDELKERVEKCEASCSKLSAWRSMNVLANPVKSVTTKIAQIFSPSRHSYHQVRSDTVLVDRSSS